MIQRRMQLLAAATGAALLALAGTAAMAESQYGYSAASATVTAQAHINLSVTVPKLILLRVGTQTGTGDTLSWTAPLTWVTAPLPLAEADNQAANWDGTAPSVGTVTNPTAVSVYAWTNSNGGGSLAYTATDFAPTGGPALSNITVTPGSGLSHPGGATLAATSSSAVTFTANTLATGTWNYSLGGTALSWTPGTYSATVTYTATGV